MSESTNLFQLLTQLRKEIETSQPDMLVNEQKPAFELQDVEVEAKFTVSGGGEAGIHIHVVKVGAEVKAEQVHTIKLKLKPTEAFLKVAGQTQNRPAPSR
jgi:hypothetical protein